MEVVIPLTLLAAACLAGGSSSSSSSSSRRFAEGFEQQQQQQQPAQQQQREPPAWDQQWSQPQTQQQQQLNPGIYDPTGIAATNGYVNQLVYQQAQQQGYPVGGTILPVVPLDANTANMGANTGTSLESLLHQAAATMKQNPVNGAGEGDWMLGGPAAAFSGARPRGQIYNNSVVESHLDSYTGAGSQFHRKSERAPLAAPQPYMSNTATGGQAPNYSDFYQSRQLPSAKQNGVLPFAQERDVPGGFQLEMEYRDLGREKTVDELRTANNPRVSYELTGLEGPLLAPVTNRGIMGEFAKNRPDTFYINGPERYFTSVAPTVFKQTDANNAEQVFRPGVEVREDTAAFYTGPAAAQAVKSAASARAERFVPSHRIQYTEADTAGLIGVGSAVHTQPFQESTVASNINAYHSTVAQHTNNRTRILKDPSKNERFGSGFTRAIGAAIAPLTDLLRPQKRDELNENTRIYGNSAGFVKESGAGPERAALEAGMASRVGGYVVSQDQPLHTEVAQPHSADPTLRESLIYTPRLQINNQAAVGGRGGYVNSNPPVANLTQRDISSIYQISNAAADPVMSLGGGGAYSAHNGTMVYDNVVASAASNQAAMDARESMRMVTTDGPNGFAPTAAQIPSVETAAAAQTNTRYVRQKELDLEGRGMMGRPPVAGVTVASTASYLPVSLPIAAGGQQRGGNRLVDLTAQQSADMLDPALLQVFRENPYTHPFAAVA